MKKPRNVFILFQAKDFKIRDYVTGDTKTIQAGVYVDLDELATLVAAAAKNKGKKAHDGALYVEFHRTVSEGGGQ